MLYSMALGPKQMSEAILRNLKSKTGKNVDEWLVIINQSGINDKKEILDFLKTKHKLGHFQAATIFQKFSEVDTYGDPEQLKTSLFPEKEQRSLYNQLEQEICALGEDVKVQPCKGYIPFYKKHQFAILKPHKKGILLGLSLPDPVNCFGFGDAKDFASPKINAQTLISRAVDFSEELKSIVLQAYKNH